MPKESTESLIPIDHWAAVKIALSAREIETLELFLEGRAVKEIAYVLELSPRTIEHRLEKIREKTGVGSGRELMAWGFESGLISD